MKSTVSKVFSQAGSISITRRLGRKIDKKLEEADILLHGGEFISNSLYSYCHDNGVLPDVKPLTSLVLGAVSVVIPLFIVNQPVIKARF